MAIIKSGATTDTLTIDTLSKAARTTDYDSTGREVSAGSKNTYAASGTFTPAATPTDLVVIEGSATKTVRVIKFEISTTNTAAGSQQFALIKRSTVDTSGTFVGATVVPFDSSAAGSTITRVGHFTVNPTLGNTVGTMVTKRVASPAAIPASFAGIVQDAGFDMISQLTTNYYLAQLVVLRGITQCLALNFAGAALVSGQTHAYNVVWTEE